MKNMIIWVGRTPIWWGDYAQVDQAWMWAALVATNLASYLHQFTAIPGPRRWTLSWGIATAKP